MNYQTTKASRRKGPNTGHKWIERTNEMDDKQAQRLLRLEGQSRELMQALEKAEMERDVFRRERDEARAENFDLRQIAVNLHWMARRYADGRCTYAPGLVNNAVRQLQAMGVELNICGERTPWARDGMGPGFSGLSKEEYELGEPIDGWNHIPHLEEIKALLSQHSAQVGLLVGALKEADAFITNWQATAEPHELEYFSEYKAIQTQISVALSTLEPSSLSLVQERDRYKAALGKFSDKKNYFCSVDAEWGVPEAKAALTPDGSKMEGGRADDSM